MTMNKRTKFSKEEQAGINEIEAERSQYSPFVYDGEAGYQERYIVKKRDGQDDPRARYFVLRWDDRGDDQKWTAACRSAMRHLAKRLLKDNHLTELANDLLRMAPAAAKETENE